MFRQKSPRWGIVTIGIVTLAALLAHWLAPDKSFNANDGSEFLTKKPPLFSVKMLKVRDDNDNTRSSFLHTLLYGRASAYTYIPITEDPEIFNDTVFFKIYPPHINKELKLPLINVTQALYPGFSRKLSYDLSLKNYYYKNDSVYFLNIQEQILTRSREDIMNEFYEEHITTRTYYLGTDEDGRDLLSRILYASRISLLGAVIASLLAVLLGTLAAILIYIFKYRRLVTKSFEVFTNLPALLGLFLIALVIQPQNLVELSICIVLGTTYKITVDIYGKIQIINNIPHIHQLGCLGFSRKKIFLTHIFPKILSYLSLSFVTMLSNSFIYETFLSFVNLSIPHYMPSIGNLINNGLEIIESSPWHIVFFPVLSLAIILFGLNAITQYLKIKFDFVDQTV